MSSKLVSKRIKLSTSWICQSCQGHSLPRTRRQFSVSTTQRAESDGMDLFAEALRVDGPAPREKPVSRLSSTLMGIGQSARNQAASKPTTAVSIDEPYHLNVYAHKHNMHMTFTNPGRDPILSLSAGNIGLKKAQRSSYDAAYQLATYTMRKMMEKQWRIGGKKSNGRTQTMQDVHRIEIILRGFGPGREAFQKALLGPEGRLIKPKVVRVTDSTRLKFGGTRSPNVRRLG